MVTEHQKANGNGHKLEPYIYTNTLLLASSSTSCISYPIQRMCLDPPAKDGDVGSARAHRPDILFQIRTPELRSVRPDGYVKYNGRIILDPFDHGLQGSMSLGVAVEYLATH